VTRHAEVGELEVALAVVRERRLSGGGEGRTLKSMRRLSGLMSR
jgi:hypothetical protein